MALDTLTDPGLVQEMLALRQGEHLCLIYERDPAEQLGALLPFISQGLNNGEQCLYVADDHTTEQVQAALRSYGIDVQGHVDRGALKLWTRQEWRQPGELSSELKAEQVRAIIERALAQGYRGVRFCVEMTWALGPDVDTTRLRHWEATLNEVFTHDTKARIVCQYNRHRLPPAVIQAALTTHPVAVIDNDVCSNTFFEAPRILSGDRSRLESGPDAVDWMISQLRWTRAYERERETRVRADAALKEASAANERIEELRLQAEASAEDLRRALKVKDEFLGLVSHELRTPIATVIGNALLLRRRGDLLEPQDKEQALDDIASEGQRLQRIVENLLVLTRAQAPNVLNTEPVVLRHLLSEFTEAFSRRHPGRNVRLDCASDLPLVLAEPSLLAQTVDNLLTNAHKYSPPEAPIELIARSTESGDAEVRVRDYGPGIEPESLDRIFDAFYRAPGARFTAPGMGLGLAVCRRVVEAQGGRVWAETRPEGGCDFVFTIKPA